MQCRRGQPGRIAAAQLLAISIASLPVMAQTTLSGERGTPLVPEADTVPAGEFSLSAAFSVTGGVPGDRFHAAPFGLTVGLSNRLELGVALQAFPRGLLQARGVEQDLRLSTKALLLTEYVIRPALSLALAADHPLQGWDFLPSVIAQKHIGPLFLTGQFGWRLPRERRDADPAGPFYGAAAALSISASTTLMLQAAGEAGRGFRNVTVMPGIAFSLLGPDPMEARRKLLRQRALETARAILGDAPAPELTTSLPPGAVADSARPPAWTGAGLFGGARTAVLQHPGRITFFATGGPAYGDRATWSVFAGIQIASFDELLQDSDGDGIPDRFDKCPYEPADWVGYQDEDGCPHNGIEVLKKRAAEALLRVEKKGTRFTTPFPRYRMTIPLRPIPTAPGRGDPREQDLPRAPPSLPQPPPPPVEKQPGKIKPAPGPKAAAPGGDGARLAKSVSAPARPPPARRPQTPPVARNTPEAPTRAAFDLQAAKGSRGLLQASLGGALILAVHGAGSSPVIPRPILRWPGRAGRPVIDALSLPLAGATSALEPRDREALASFAARAARTNAELEVWGRSTLLREPDEAVRYAQSAFFGAALENEIAQLATWLGGLPPGRAYAVPSLWPLASGAGVVILLVPPAGVSR